MAKFRRGYSKYRATKTKIDGIQFDSKKEANRYVELKYLEKSGKIKFLELQPAYVVVDGFECCGKKERPVIYKADFLYKEVESGRYVVEDVKGMKTAVYRIKRKLFLQRYIVPSGGELVFREI